MIDRYINNKINAIWNDQNKFDTWKLIQEKYVETLEQLKIAKGGVAKKIQEADYAHLPPPSPSGYAHPSP